MTQLKLCQDKEEWDNYVLDHNGHPFQLWGWGDVKTAHGWITQRLFLYDNNGDGEAMGAVQLLVRPLPWPFRSVAYVPRGPITDESHASELMESLASYVKTNHHSVSVIVEPDVDTYTATNGWRKSANHILPSQTILLDLERNEAELLNDMAKKTRQYIRKSESEAIEIKLVRQREELDKCLEIYHATAKRAKFNLHSDQYYYDVFDKLDDHSPVFAAYVDNQPVAFLWLAISADTAYELYGGMNELGQQLRANYILKWHAIKQCRKWELSRYDFGGLIDGGVSTFKLGWAEQKTEFIGTLEKPLSAAYTLWSKLLPSAKKITHKIASVAKKSK
jgi:lipid II:glycine glycyltransferase (peptidoglycan interpeptide bridge formation enzyme)